MVAYTKIICVDFDGVLHSYTSGWQGEDVISDPPVENAIWWLQDQLYRSINQGFEIAIYSSRSKTKAGIQAMKNWLTKHGLSDFYLDRITFPTQKPAAFLTIDDRAICFTGTFPTTEEMLTFKPWNK
jgi:hypothetical protein